MLHKLLQFSLTQRFLVILTSLIVIGMGIVSWRSLTLDAVPDISPNLVQVNTQTGGLGPEEVEKLVTFPIETAMGGISGVKQVRSVSRFGLSQVSATFQEGVDIYFARSQVLERLSTIRGDLPANVKAPKMGPVTTGLGDIYIYALQSDSRSIMDLRALQDWSIAPQIRTVPGVAEVGAADGSERQYQVVVRLRDLIARGIGIADVVSALKKNNENAGGGALDQNGQRLLVRSVGLATSIDDIRNTVVKTESGVSVLIRDIADVTTGTPVLTGVSTLNGKEALVCVVMMVIGSNGRTVADAVDAKVHEIERQLPPDVHLVTTYNRSELVNATVHTVQSNLIEGGSLVILVLLLLLGNPMGAVTVAAAIPLAMLLAIVAMNQFGISGNLMSLGAIDFGLIVDGAVVMIENAVRRIAEARVTAGRNLDREEVRQAVHAASIEVARPTTFAVAIITVVYLPILSLQGTEGKMFKPMAFTVVFALLGALLVTLTLIPALGSLVLSGGTREESSPAMNFLAKLYRPSLDFALRQRGAVLAAALVVFGFAVFLFPRLGSEFIPQLDEGSFLVKPVRPPNVSAQETLKLVGAEERAVLKVPEVSMAFSKSGSPEVSTDPMPISETDGYVMLKPRSKWRPGMTKEKIREALQERLDGVPGQGYSFSQPIQDAFNDLLTGVTADVGIRVFGDNLDVLKAKADQVAAVVGRIPGATDVQVEQVDRIPILQIDLDRAAIARYGISISDVQGTISTLLGGDPVGQIIRGDKRFSLTVRLPDDERNDPVALENVPIETPDGGHVPLSALSRIHTVSAPAQISRDNGKRRVVVQMNVRGRDLGSFIKEARAAVSSQVTLPSGYYVSWGGQFQNLESASARLWIVVPVALSLIFVLLLMTFGSTVQALLILTGVPLAVTGGVFALAIRGLPFSISAGVGFIALSGVAVLNGVVLVSAINQLLGQGLSCIDAVRQGSMRRLRPVLMTALVAALGFVPMAFNTGIGSEVQRPLATVVVGGIASSTLLTLVVLPILFLRSHPKAFGSQEGFRESS